MKKEYMDWFRREFNRYRELRGSTPKLKEYSEFVKQGLDGSPLRKESEGAIQDLATEAFGEVQRELQISESRDSEIQGKIRDADTNLHRRKYVDGSF